MIYKPDQLNRLERDLAYIYSRRVIEIDIRHMTNKVFVPKCRNIHACKRFWVYRDRPADGESIIFNHSFSRSSESQAAYVANNIQYKLLTIYEYGARK